MLRDTWAPQRRSSLSVAAVLGALLAACAASPPPPPPTPEVALPPVTPAPDPAPSGRCRSPGACESRCSDGDGEACIRFASMLRFGQGLPTDARRSEHYVDEACRLGNTLGCMRRASHLLDRGQTAAAMELLDTACDGGYGPACRQLADILRVGILVPPDDARVATLEQRQLAWAERECERDDAWACGVLSVAYKLGRHGLARDDAKSLRFHQRELRIEREACGEGDVMACSDLAGDLALNLHQDDLAASLAVAEKACQLEDASSCYDLARAHRYGDGRPTDPARARTFMLQSCALGYALACEIVAEDSGAAGRFPRQAELAPATQPALRAHALRRADCDVGMAFQCETVARDFANQGDHDLATHYHERWLELLTLDCARHGGTSCNRAAEMILDGDASGASANEALVMLERGCTVSPEIVCDELAERLRDGRGVPVDRKRARALYERGCAADDAGACIEAARLDAAGTPPGPAPTQPVARAIELLDEHCERGRAIQCGWLAELFEKGELVVPDPERAAAARERACALSSLYCEHR